MKFKYSAKTKDGKATRQGEIEAPDQGSAIKLLREKNLIVFSLIPITNKTGLFSFLSSIKGIPLREKVKFTDQLANMVSAGLPLTKALEILSTQTKNKKMADIIKNVLNDVEAGTALSTSLRKAQKVFPKSYVSLVRAGESSGKLDKVLKRLAETLEKERQFRSKVKGALIYPVIITLAMVGVFIIIIIFVIPKMSEMYESLNVDLPIMTRMLISLSKFIITSWWIVLLVTAGVIYGIKFFKSTPQGKYTFAKLTFKMPIFGNLTRQAGLVEFTRTLGLLVESGVPIIEGLEIVKDSTDNILYSDATKRFIADVKHGYPLSQSIAKEKDFPPLLAQMLVVGEETGSVAKSLNNLSAYYEGEVDKIVKNLSTAMEPIIMVLLGVMVGLLIISVITPIYQLTSQF